MWVSYFKMKEMWCEYNNQKKKKTFMEVSAIFPFKKLKSLKAYHCISLLVWEE